MPVNACTFPNVGWLETEVPDNLKELVKEAIADRGEDYRKALAGHTSGAFSLPKLEKSLEYEHWLITLAQQYDEAFPAYRNTICHTRHQMTLQLNDVWVNYQAKHDFNPMHWHAGVFSFVTWIDIPYLMGEEKERYGSNSPAAGEFAFTVTDVLGEIHDQPVEQREWMTLFFPAKLRHRVHPFYTSDKMRISLAGNLDLV